MTDDPRAAALEQAVGRINDYLGNGGLWNPDLMDHDKVQRLLLDIRSLLLKAAPPTEGPTWQPIDGPNAFMQGQLDAARAEIARLEQKCDERFLEGIKHEQRRLCR